MTGINLRIIYITAKGAVIYRELADATETEVYLQARDGPEFRTYRKDRILEVVDDTTNIPGRLSYWEGEYAGSGSTKHVVRPSIPGVLEVCFTGFKSADKKALAALTEAAGFTVRKKISTQLDVLCCGPNAGPAKLERAREKGCLLLTEDQFLVFKNTGEIPLDT